MSEYQYYEFLAVDRALAPRERSALRRVSTRATITSSSFANEYNWGDLKANPINLLQRYFDVHLYLSNWGTRIFAIRLPSTAISSTEQKAYLPGLSAAAHRMKGHTIVELASQEEEPAGGDWEEGSAWMASVNPVRAEILGGDPRPLYIAWLLAVQQEEVADPQLEPQVPAGLKELTAAQEALASFLRLDPHLLAAAAEASRPQEDALAGLPDWIRLLTAEEKDTLLIKVARGEHQAVRSALLSRYTKAKERRRSRLAGGTRTVGGLLARAEVLREAAAQREARKRARLRKRQAAAAAAARKDRLDALEARGKRVWTDVENLVQERSPKAYDEAVALVIDLREIAARNKQDLVGFEQRLDGIRGRHGKKYTLMGRLDKAARLGWRP